MIELFILVGVSLLVAGVLIFFISLHDQKMKNQQANDETWPSNHHTGEKFDIRSFSKVCMDLCEILKLEVTEVSQPGTDEFVIKAVSENPITRVEYLVCGILLPNKSVLGSGRIQEISEQVISERLSKAIIITTGTIDPVALGFAEQAPLEFIDGTKLNQLIIDYKLS